MGLILTHEEIVAYLQEQGLHHPLIEETLVYAQVMPTVGQFFLFGQYAQLVKGSYFVLGLDEDQVVLLPLHKVTGKIDRKVEPMFIPFNKIDDIKIKNGMMWYSVTIQGEGHELPLKLAKHALGMKWHKNNLAPVLKMLENI